MRIYYVSVYAEITKGAWSIKKAVYALAHESMAFVRNAIVREALRIEEGCLLLILRNGKIGNQRVYPRSRD